MQDQAFMERAIRLGHCALGATAENPPVGCVIVNHGQIVGVGWTQPGGRPHAETQALAMAGEWARGAAAYVTLEPCAHHGRTSPCADALIAAGIARVVTAQEDPDPRVQGGGHARLRKAGIEVTTGIGSTEASRDLAGFLSRITRGRPYVVLKLAVSSDGKIAAGAGQRTAITGDEVRARVHLLRAQCDAVLVGLSTALIDDPELTCRLPGLEHRSPVRVVTDSRLSFPPRLKLARTAAEVPVWLLATRRDTAPAEEGISIIDCLATPEGWVDLNYALQELGKRGINRLLVEGGAHVARSFLESGLVDEFQQFQSPMVIGSGGLDALAGGSIESFMQGWSVLRQETLGEDRLTVYVRAESNTSSADS